MYKLNCFCCLIWILIFEIHSQNIEISKCREYKVRVYEKKLTYGFFAYNAPELSIIKDSCAPIEPFIVGGIPAKPKEFPHMARLGYFVNGQTNWFCGGSLISEKFVLTAAHCFYPQAGEVNLVRLGELDFSIETDDSDPEDFGILKLIPHPQYEDNINGLVYNDIGLIELNRSVIFNKYKHPACLPINDGNNFNSFVATGWGSTAFASSNSDKLLKVKLEPLPYERCYPLIDKATENLQNNETQMCAGSQLSRDTCKGDSGGPLLAFHDEFPCMYYVSGITSAGIGGCGVPNVPGIYTRVYGFIPWIRGIVWP